MPSPAELTPPQPHLPRNPTSASSRSASPAQPASSSAVPIPPPISAISSQSAPSPDPHASIQSILAATKKASTPVNGQLPTWTSITTPSPAHETPIAGPSSLSLAPSHKRKLDDADSEDPHSKIRRVVRDHVSQDPTRVMPMTTVVCLHAAVAQKSYGSEKRFLCPPPVVHIEGPVWQMRQQQLSMSVVPESGERSFEQKAALDTNMTANFKFLHVTGTAKAKSFQLTLDIAEAPPSAVTPETEGAEQPTGRIWASFDSAPVTIISKPSKKTAKTRNISSCILAGGPVSLFNRINSQTVRTKYMTIDHAQLCASNVAWSAFNVNVMRRPTDTTPISGPQPVTYGCEIMLTDTHSGISTAPLIIRKVDKGRVSADDGGPVSQMQKIALQRVNHDGSRHYLSAAGPIPGTPGVVASPTSGMPPPAGTHPLLFSSPRVRDELKDGVRVISDEVDDYLCWTIVGISKFQYTFFDAFGQNNSIPETPITPFPTLFTAPIYRPTNNTVELTVTNFFYEDPNNPQRQQALDIYLGNLGPLRYRVYSTSPPGPLTTISPFLPAMSQLPLDNGAGPSTEAAGGLPQPMPNHRYNTLHTMVIVEMPPLPDVIKALEEDALPPNEEPSGSPQNETSGPNSPDDGQNGSGAQPPSIAGRTLPLLFIRSSDGIGYHSGRTIACENVFHSIDLASIGANPSNPAGGSIDTGWLAAAQATAAADGGLHGWTLRVM